MSERIRQKNVSCISETHRESSEKTRASYWTISALSARAARLAVPGAPLSSLHSFAVQRLAAQRPKPYCPRPLRLPRRPGILEERPPRAHADLQRFDHGSHHPVHGRQGGRARLPRLVEWQIDQGTHGLVPCGTTGESP